MKPKILFVILLFVMSLQINAQQRNEEIIEFTGDLKVGKTYRAEIKFDAEYDDWQSLIPLKLPHHHVRRIDWTNLFDFKELKKPKPNERRQFTFKVIKKKVYQAAQNRWNTIYYCKIIKVL